jgi:hypothetical protein
MGASIVRLYRAINKVDPDGTYRWYVDTDGSGLVIEAQGNYNDCAFQATCEIYGHESRYDQVIMPVFTKMEKVMKSLMEAKNDTI